MDISALVKLAGIDDNKELMTELGLTSDVLSDSEFSSALQELQNEEKKQAMKQAAKQVIELLKLSGMRTQGIVEEIRHIRRREKMLLACVKQIELAKQYASETNNYIPLMVAAEYNNPVTQRRMIAELPDKATIPEGWTPKNTAVKTTAVKKTPVKK